MKGFKSTLANPYTYTQSGVWKKGQYTFQAIVKSDSGYAFAFQRADTTWQTIDLSWQVRAENYCKVQWTFTLEADAVAFRLIANRVTGETIVVQPMLEKGTNGSTPIAHEEDLRGMDGDNHEFIFTRNDTGIAPPTPLSTQENDHIPIDDSVEPPVIWTDNPQGVTKELPFEFVSMREKKNGVWLNFSPPSLWAKWSEDGLSVNIRVQGHYQSHWEGVNKVTEIVGGEIINGTEVVKCTAIFRKGEEDIASDIASSRGFIWEVNGVEIARDVPYITLDESYGDGFADYVTLSYLIGNKRESDQAEILNISEGMDGIGEEFIFKANNSEETPPALPSTTDEGYQNDDYHGDWSDDPVAPTESNQFVWTAKRKKVGGIWEAFGTPSIWTKWVEDGEPGEDGEDGITISTNQQGYTYRADLNGDIIGSLANGMVELTIMSGSTPITCSSATSGGTPTTNGTYRVTRTLGSGITTNSSLSGGKYRITPATLTVDEASVELEIKIMMGGVVTSYPLTLTYRKQFDGADGKSTEFIFKGHTSDTTAPTLPSTSQQDDWYGQGTANEWNDNLVEPTKALPYVWASQRKKVDGVWGAFTTPKVWLRYAEDGDDGEDAKSIHLNPSAKAISITKGNIPVPTSVTVIGTAVNTTIQYWYYSVNGATSFTSTAPTGVTRSGNQVTINSATATFKTLSIKAGNSSDDVEDVVTITRSGGAPYVDETTRTWWEWDEELGVYTDTGMSPVGSDGRIPYPAGYYESTKRYRREQDYTPYVQYGEVLYLLIKDTPNAGILPTNTTYWKAFNQWEAVFVDSLVAQFAKIGGAVFTGDTSNVSSNIRGRLISQKGVNNTNNYNTYTGDSGSWQPKLMLDFLTGKIKALDGEIGHFAIVDGKLTANYTYMTHLPGGAYVQVTSDIQLTPGGIIISNSYGGTADHPSVVQWNIEITSAGVKVGNYEIRRDGFYEYGNKIELGGGSGYVLPVATQTTLGGIKVGSRLTISSGVLSANVQSDNNFTSAYKNKLDGIATGANNYTHPSTHPASMITEGTFPGIVKANNNTSYTTKQVRNIILSTGDAVSSQMANGDIWIKYE